MKTGLIGLGAMGQGMARRLAAAGYLTAIYNRTASKAEQLGWELNVNVCASPGELAASVDAILICVSADQDVMEMVNAVAQTVKPGAIITDMSTVSSETAQTAATLYW
jgi:3-hydroxyisobutyrate dehydrogenase